MQLNRLVCPPQVEALIIGAILVYVGLAFLGKWINKKLASRWLGVHIPYLRTQFASVGTTPSKGALITADGANRFWTYASGRRHVRSLHITIDCRPRSDFFMLGYEFGRSAVDLTWTGAGDFIQFELSLDISSKEDFVWAIAEKRVMNSLPKSRWDLVRRRRRSSSLTALSLRLTPADVRPW
jgi:Protein of unknown function (DUF1682)